MVHFIYGPCGSGKTSTLYKYLESDIKQGKKAFFIVPEQETVSVERSIASLFPTSVQLDVEVLNFSRLCNRIFRTGLFLEGRKTDGEREGEGTGRDREGTGKGREGDRKGRGFLQQNG